MSFSKISKPPRDVEADVRRSNISTPNTPKASLKTRNGAFEALNSTDRVPGTPLVVSPTESSCDSNDDDESIWDTPEHGEDKLRTEANIDITTPLTPPMTGNDAKKQTFVIRSPLERKASNSTHVDLSAAGAFKEESIASVLTIDPESGDYFTPKKLSRNLSKVLQEISRANEKQAGARFALPPVFDFSHTDSVVPVPGKQLPKRRSIGKATRKTKIESSVPGIPRGH